MAVLEIKPLLIHFLCINVVLFNFSSFISINELLSNGTKKIQEIFR